MKTGNVILSPYGNMEIVVDIRMGAKNREVVHTISFDYENSSGIHELNDYKRTEACDCFYSGEPQYDCEICNGTGEVTKEIKGWSRSKILASNVKEYIKKSLLKNFEGLK